MILDASRLVLRSRKKSPAEYLRSYGWERIKRPGSSLEILEREGTCAREHQHTPPKYAFRPKDPHFEINPHDFLGYTRTSAISTRFASLQVRVLDRLIELGQNEYFSLSGNSRIGFVPGETREANDAEKNYHIFLLSFFPFLFYYAALLVLSPIFRRVSFQTSNYRYESSKSSAANSIDIFSYVTFQFLEVVLFSVR